MAVIIQISHFMSYDVILGYALYIYIYIYIYFSFNLFSNRETVLEVFKIFDL